jgi:vitamin B12 transporter
MESLMFDRYQVQRAPLVRRPHALMWAVLAACTAPVAAQQQLPTVTITATREPQNLDRVTSDMVIITAERIRASGAESVEDLLRSEVGVQMSRNGGPGHSAGVFIRGASAGNTVVLIDGVRAGSATLGSFGFEALSLSQIDRIEVLRGPGSSLYGADAVGGVIQIFTQRGQAGQPNKNAPRIAANLALGTYRSGEAGFSLSGMQADVDYAAFLGHERSSGVSTLAPSAAYNYNADADGYSRNIGQLKLGYAPTAGHRVGLSLVETHLNAQFDDSAYDPVTYEVDTSPDFRSRLKSRVVALDYRGVISPTWAMTTQLSHNDDDLYSGANQIDHYRTLRHQFTWQNAFKLTPEQQLMLAFEHLRDQAEATPYENDKTRRNNALMAGYTGQWGTYALQADVRHDRNSAYGNSSTGRLGANMALNAEWRVRALAGTSFRAPTFNELYYPGYGVTSVTPERGRSLELGVNWRSDASQNNTSSEAALTVYRNRISNMIGYEENNAQCPADAAYAYGCARNINEARLQGATLSGAHRFGALQVSATLDALDAKDLGTGKRLSRRAAHQESLSLDYGRGAWNLGATVLAVGSRPDSGKELASYETLDLRARWRFTPQWQLEAKLLNATNRQIEPARDYQTPGRQAWVGIRFEGAGL